MDIDCPIECIDRSLICESPPDFLEKHSSFLITLIGILSGSVGVVLTYFLKSRCTEIRCFGMWCKRKPMESTDVESADVKSVNVNVSSTSGEN